MHKLFLATALAVLSACYVPVENRGGVVYIGASEGGIMETHEPRIAAMKARGQVARFTGDYCWSACTMYLAVAECVPAKTQFGFHSAMTAFFGPNPARNLDLAQYYPGKLRDWFLYTGSRYDLFGVTPLRGVEVSKLTGLPLCR